MRIGIFRKRKSIFILIFMIFLLFACEEPGLGDLLDQSNGSSSPEIIEKNDPSEKQDAEKDNQTVEKTLVWYVPSNILPEANVDEAIYTQFNEMLQQKGTDYSVEFVGFELEEKEIEAEIKEITEIYDEYRELWIVQDDEYWELWDAQDTDISEQIDKVNQELQDVGIDQVLDVINSQFRTWWDDK